MARTRKSRPKAKVARAMAASKTRSRKAPPARRKPARPKSDEAPSSDPLDGFIEAAARLLALPIEPQWRAVIKANLEVNLRLAAFVAEFALPDETEPEPVFTA
jgi:hypothetical protein